MKEICTIDLGFSWTKGGFKNRIFREPSIIGEVKDLYDGNLKSTDFIYKDEHFVGGLALRHSDLTYFSMKDNKTDMWVTDVLLETAVGYLTRKEPCNVITGLPIKFFFNQKNDLEQKIMNLNDLETYKIKHGKSKMYYCNPKIIKAKSVPQGYGLTMDYVLNEDGTIGNRDVARKKILGIDLGFYTLNLLGLDKLEIMKESKTLLLGVETAYKLLQRYIQDKIGKSPALYELDEYVISGTYEGFDITPLIKKAFRNLAIQIQNEIESLNINFDCYVIGGGAAHFVYEYLNLPNKILLDQLAQIRGYRKIGVRVWK
ncbi:ParM/StbA family protein [Paenibacillus sp. N1-5-1-14]|uniref:ParM/StbA family protein n=1 Tax=Paenibacillus radicibacter TaxID=2972488 RepID=UPI00215938B2|nr:ParM/StbA family protein [Paenibacillus radicibacter]MCR8641372.1 ParM/StbA family protein [Paenibacillus radicibacter]